MKTSLMRTRWAAIGAAVAVTLGGGAVYVANATSTTYHLQYDEPADFTFAAGSIFVPITPCRLLDTRSGNVPNVSPAEPYYRGIYYGEIGSTSSQGANWTGTNNIPVYFDRGLNEKAVTNNGVPTTALGDCVDHIQAGHDPTAIVANLTITGVESSSYVELYPYMTPSSKPYFSSITVYPGSAAQMNNVVIPLASATTASGDFTNKKAFRIYNEYAHGFVNVIVDVVGYYHLNETLATITRGLY